LSHFARSPSCVVLPDPSIPSTTNSFPGYSCGCMRLFSITLDGRLERDPADLDSHWFAREALERRRVAHGGPELQLGVARGAQLQQVVVAAIVELEPRDRLRVAAVEALGEPQDRGQRAHGAAQAPRQLAEAGVLPLRRRLTM